MAARAHHEAQEAPIDRWLEEPIDWVGGYIPDPYPEPIAAPPAPSSAPRPEGLDDASQGDQRAKPPSSHHVVVCVVGPPTAGKSTLSAALEKTFAARVVPESLREVMGGSTVPITHLDIEQAATLFEQRLSAALAPVEASLVVLDTDLTSLCVWADFSLGARASDLEERARSVSVDLYLVLSPRHRGEGEAPPTEAEQRLFSASLREVGERPHLVLDGPLPARERAAIEAVGALLRARAT